MVASAPRCSMRIWRGLGGMVKAEFSATARGPTLAAHAGPPQAAPRARRARSRADVRGARGRPAGAHAGRRDDADPDGGAPRYDRQRKRGPEDLAGGSD